MKATLIFYFVVFTFTAHADVRAITLELSRNTFRETLVSVTSNIKEENQANLKVPEAATLLRQAKHLKDAIIVIIHSEETIPLADLLPLFGAMSDNHIEIEYMQIGQCPTVGDIWNQRGAGEPRGAAKGSQPIRPDTK